MFNIYHCLGDSIEVKNLKNFIIGASTRARNSCIRDVKAVYTEFADADDETFYREIFFLAFRKTIAVRAAYYAGIYGDNGDFMNNDHLDRFKITQNISGLAHKMAVIASVYGKNKEILAKFKRAFDAHRKPFEDIYGPSIYGNKNFPWDEYRISQLEILAQVLEAKGFTVRRHHRKGQLYDIQFLLR